MTLLLTALHYAGVTAVLMAGARLASAVGRPRVVRIMRGEAAETSSVFWTPKKSWTRCFASRVEVLRIIAIDGALAREFYFEPTDVIPWDKATGEDDAWGRFEADLRERAYQRAEARAARGDRPVRIEAA